MKQLDRLTYYMPAILLLLQRHIDAKKVSSILSIDIRDTSRQPASTSGDCGLYTHPHPYWDWLVSQKGLVKTLHFL